MLNLRPNILYDGLFGVSIPVGIPLVGFADHISVVATARNEELLMDTVNGSMGVTLAP